jgi:hypothetical protein
MKRKIVRKPRPGIETTIWRVVSTDHRCGLTTSHLHHGRPPAGRQNPSSPFAPVERRRRIIARSIG